MTAFRRDEIKSLVPNVLERIALSVLDDEDNVIHDIFLTDRRKLSKALSVLKEISGMPRTDGTPNEDRMGQLAEDCFEELTR